MALDDRINSVKKSKISECVHKLVSGRIYVYFWCQAGTSLKKGLVLMEIVSYIIAIVDKSSRRSGATTLLLIFERLNLKI